MQVDWSLLAIGSSSLLMLGALVCSAYTFVDADILSVSHPPASPTVPSWATDFYSEVNDDPSPSSPPSPPPSPPKSENCTGHDYYANPHISNHEASYLFDRDRCCDKSSQTPFACGFVLDNSSCTVYLGPNCTIGPQGWGRTFSPTDGAYLKTLSSPLPPLPSLPTALSLPSPASPTTTAVAQPPSPSIL